MNSNRLNYLQTMGVQCWAPRVKSSSDIINSRAATLPFAEEQAGHVTSMGWDDLRHCVENCERCALSSSRNLTVFGSGSQSASWMLVGEVPGKDEDLQGRPFVGRAGRLLTEMLLAVGRSRESVYIANILKCRPPENRNPALEEVQSCKDYLQRQVELVQPKVLLAVGRIAAQNLLGTDQPMKALRGKVHHYGSAKIPVVVIYHPAYLLRSPTEKRKAWRDLQLASETIG